MHLHHIAICLAITGCALEESDEPETDSVGQEANYANYSNCQYAGVYSNRVCLDFTTYYGPVIQIYTNNKIAYSFGVDASQTDYKYRGSWVNYYTEWQHISGTMTAARHPSSDPFVTVSGPNDRPNGIGVLDPHNHDILEWFSGTKRYVFMTAY